MSASARTAASQAAGRPFFGPLAPTADGPRNLLDAGALYAGESVARIHDIRPAGELVRDLAPRGVRRARRWPAPARRSSSRSSPIVVALLRDDGPPAAPEPPPGEAEAGRAAVRRGGVPAVRLRRRRDERDFLDRGSRGMAHIVYALSPAGVEASVARTTRWRGRSSARSAARALDADDLEAMLFLESAGRPTVMADGTPASATGLMQIIPSTAVSLLGMRVDLARSLEINRRLRARSGRRCSREGEEAARCAAARAPRCCASGRSWTSASTRRSRSTRPSATCSIARRRFGREDLAIASYHMGIGNLTTVIDTYVSPRRPRTQHAPDGRALRAFVAAALLRLVARPATRAPGSS